VPKNAVAGQVQFRAHARVAFHVAFLTHCAIGSTGMNLNSGYEFAMLFHIE
jgi:hypothetical protein